MSLHVHKVHTFSGHEGPIYTLELAEGAFLFFSGGSDYHVNEWNFNPGFSSKMLANAGAIIYSLRYIPEKNLLVIGTSVGAMHVIDILQKKEIRNIVHHQQGIFDIQYSLLHNKLFTASGEGTMAVWALDDFALLKTFRLCDGKIRSLDLNRGENQLAIACGDGTVHIFNPENLEAIVHFKAHDFSANCVKFHPDGKYLLSGGRDAHIKAWKTDTYENSHIIPAHHYAVYSISFSPDKKYFATGSRDKTVKIWNADSLDFLYRIDREKDEGHLYSVNKVMWMHDKNYLLSAGDDRTIRAWKITESQQE